MGGHPRTSTDKSAFRFSYLCIVLQRWRIDVSPFNHLRMSVFIKVKKNTIKGSTSYGKFFGHVAATTTMTYSELCKHMSEHNSVYGEDLCLGVAKKLERCILEQLLEGKKVQFGDLGTFYLSLKGEGSESEKDYSINNINGLYLRFAANRCDINDLTSKTLKKRASFKNVKELFENTKNEDTSTDMGNTGD